MGLKDLFSPFIVCSKIRVHPSAIKPVRPTQRMRSHSVLLLGQPEKLENEKFCFGTMFHVTAWFLYHKFIY